MFFRKKPKEKKPDKWIIESRYPSNPEGGWVTNLISTERKVESYIKKKIAPYYELVYIDGSINIYQRRSTLPKEGEIIAKPFFRHVRIRELRIREFTPEENQLEKTVENS